MKQDRHRETQNTDYLSRVLRIVKLIVLVVFALEVISFTGLNVKIGNRIFVVNGYLANRWDTFSEEKHIQRDFSDGSYDTVWDKRILWFECLEIE